MLILPTETLSRDIGSVGVCSTVIGRGGTMGLAKGVATNNESSSLFVIHGHAAERCTDVSCSSNWVRDTVGAYDGSV